jgi:NtrC-family two-component system response regulator AlgB
MKAVREQVQHAAAHDLPVLFRGEKGTGRTLLARTLHTESARRDGPFVVVSCQARPEEVLARIEVAQGATLYLNEIGKAPPELQAKLVGLLQEKHLVCAGVTRMRSVDARLVAASSRDLEAEVRAGQFREDLLSLLQATRIDVPPLRERFEDILPLAHALAASFAHQTGSAVPRIPRATRKLLVTWPWPGNVRELRDVIERALIRAAQPVLAPEALPARLALQPEGVPMLGGPHTAAEMEREHAIRVLAWAGSVSEAARILGIHENTLRRKCKTWGL